MRKLISRQFSFRIDSRQKVAINKKASKNATEKIFLAFLLINKRIIFAKSKMADVARQTRFKNVIFLNTKLSW